MSHPFAFIVISSVALLLLGGASWADEELEFASSLGGEDDVGVDPGASPQQPGPRKRNLAALARGGRLPGFHYHKKLGPGSQGGGGGLLPGRMALAAQQQAQRQEQGWMGDQAFPGDVPEKIGVVGALGRLSEAAIFPYIGPHRYSFLRSMRMRRAASNSSPQQPLRPGDLARDKRNVAALARNGWLPRGASSRGTRADVLRRQMSSSSSSQEPNTDEQFFAEEEADVDCIQDGRPDVGYDQLVLMPEGVKRNLGHLARMGRLPPFNYRRLWNGQAESPATSPWPQARSKRQARRCRPNEEAKRNVAAMARKGMLPRS